MALLIYTFQLKNNQRPYVIEAQNIDDAIEILKQHDIKDDNGELPAGTWGRMTSAVGMETLKRIPAPEERSVEVAPPTLGDGIARQSKVEATPTPSEPETDQTEKQTSRRPWRR